MLIGPAIRSAREKVGMSQKDLALKANIQKNHLSKIENCHHEPTIEVLERIGSAIGIEGWRIYRFATRHEMRSLTTADDYALTQPRSMS